MHSKSSLVQLFPLILIFTLLIQIHLISKAIIAEIITVIIIITSKPLVMFAINDFLLLNLLDSFIDIVTLTPAVDALIVAIVILQVVVKYY